MKKQAAQLFLCHSHSDKPFVRKLARDLASVNVNVWLDEWELQPGDSLHACVGAALESVAYVGVVLSPDSVTSNWCNAELQHALARERKTGKKVAIPILHRRVAVPPFLLDRLYANFSKSYLTALTQLAGFLHGVDVRDLSEALLESPPKDIDDVSDRLVAAGWSGPRYLNAKDYEALRKLLKKAGVHLVGDEFDMVGNESDAPLPPKKGRGKKKPVIRKMRLRIKK
jgi:hypothetical protein